MTPRARSIFPEEIGILVGLEVAHTDDNRFWIKPAAIVPMPWDNFSTKYFFRVSISIDKVTYSCLHGLIGNFFWVNQCHRVDLDIVVDDKLHPGKPDAVAETLDALASSRIPQANRSRPGGVTLSDDIKTSSCAALFRSLLDIMKL